MVRKSRDIYESDRTPKGFDQPYEGSGNPFRNNPWYAMIQRSRRILFMIKLVVAILLMVLGYFIIEYFYEQTRLPVQKSGAASVIAEIRSMPIMDLEGSMRKQFIMDELEKEDLSDIPEEGGVPLDMHWLKQATYYLLQADKAYSADEWEAAIYFYSTALDIYPDLGGVWAQIGLCHMQLKQYTNSVAAFETAVSEKESSYRILNNLGVATLALDLYEKAEAYFLEAEALQPEYAPTHYNLGLLYMQTGEMEKANHQFSEFFKYGEVTVQALQNRALVQIALERWEEASETLLLAIERYPQSAPLYFKLAQVQAQTDDVDAAMRALYRGVRLLDANKALAILSDTAYDSLRNSLEFKQLVSSLGNLE